MKQVLSLTLAVLVLSIGMISADMLVAGITFDINSSGMIPIANASVNITCEFSGSSENVTVNSSDPDGIYAYVFDNDCTGIIVNASSPQVMYINWTVPEGSSAPSNGKTGGSSGGVIFDAETIKEMISNPEEAPITIPEEENQPTTNPVTGFITGAVTGIADFAQSGVGIVSIIGLVLIATGGVVFFNLRKSPKVAKKVSKE